MNIFSLKRRFVPLYVIAGALAAELAAGIALFHGVDSLSVAFHMVAGLLAGVGTRYLRLREGRECGLSAALVAAILVLCLPGAGILGVLFSVIPAWFHIREEQPDGIIEVDIPTVPEEFLDPDIQTSPQMPVEWVLENSTEVDPRVNAVMSLRRMDSRRAVPLLRRALLDPSEEVHLLAHAMLARRERTIRKRIEKALHQVEAYETGAIQLSTGEHAEIRRALAQDNWELVYSGFVDRELLTNTLRAAAENALAAIRISSDGATAVLLARIQIQMGAFEAAWEWLRFAESRGVASSVSGPLFAELAFIKRWFEYVPAQLSRAAAPQLSRPQLMPVVAYWKRKNAE
jgi:hypothetical protein